jgi:cell division transport system permease protein
MLGLKRARLATTIAISTVAITLTLLGVFIVLTVNVQRVIGLLNERLNVEIFIDNSIDPLSIKLLQNSVSGIEGVGTVTYISKEEALERFRNEFGEDPLAILGENPLPASLLVKIKNDYRIPEKMVSIVEDIKVLKGVDEVIYHDRLFRLINQYSKVILAIDIGLFFIVFLSVILLVSNTLRLTILSQQKNIQIMQLVGATISFVRRPYLVQGVFQGFIGGVISMGIVWAIVQLIRFRFPHLLVVPLLVLIMPLLIGMVISYLGSLVALKRFLNA